MLCWAYYLIKFEKYTIPVPYLLVVLLDIIIGPAEPRTRLHMDTHPRVN